MHAVPKGPQQRPLPSAGPLPRHHTRERTLTLRSTCTTHDDNGSTQRHDDDGGAQRHDDAYGRGGMAKGYGKTVTMTTVRRGHPTAVGPVVRQPCDR